MVQLDTTIVRIYGKNDRKTKALMPMGSFYKIYGNDRAENMLNEDDEEFIASLEEI